jgi:HK97 family phage portal protein
MNLWPFGRKAQAAPETKNDTISLDELARRMAAMSAVFSGVSVTPQNAMKCTTVHGIVRALTNAIGSYPPSVGKLVRGEHGQYVEADPNHNVNRLLRKPNAAQTTSEFWRMAMQHTLTWGNFYAIKGQGQSGPISFLRPIENPDSVTLDGIETRTSRWGLGPVFRIDGIDLPDRFVPASRMFRMSSGILSEDGITGRSPVELAKEAIGICIAAEQYIAELYGNNAMPALVVTGAKFSNKEQFAMWRDAWKEAYGAGTLGRGGTAMLQDGMDVKEMAWKPIDAQVLEMRKFQRIEIAQVYGVPPHKLADLERATFSNIEEQSLEFVRDTAKPWVILAEQGAGRDLLSEADQQRGYVIRFNMESATEGKFKERIEAFGKAHEIGAMNPNEIRQRIGLDPRTDEGGEAYATPLNMRTTEDDVPDDDEEQEPTDENSEGDDDASSIRAVR